MPSKGRESLLAVFKAVRRCALPLEVVGMGFIVTFRPLERIGERPLLGFSFFILLLFSLPWAGAALRLVSDIPEMVLGNIRHQLCTQRAKP